MRWLDDEGRSRVRHLPDRESAEHAAEVIYQRLNAWAVPHNRRLWDTVIAEYDEAIAGLSDKSAAEIDRALGRLKATCDPATLADLSPRLFDRYFAARRKAGAKDATLAKEWRVLHAFCGWLVRRKYLPDNPLSAVACPKPVARARRVPRPDDWLRLLKSIPDCESLDDPQGWHLLIVLAVATGLRQSALLGLRVADVEVAAKGIGLVKSFTPKTRKERLHGLPPAVNDRIARRIADLPAGAERLFLWSGFQRKAWERLTQAAGFSFSFHRLRAASAAPGAIARLEAAAAAHLDHSSVAVFRGHYADEESQARLVAKHMHLPELPRMPRFVLRSNQGWPVAGSGKRGR